MRVRISGLLALTGAMALAGCPNAELAPLEPCTVSGVVREVQQNAIDKVDVLFVIDNSGSMAEEQAALAEQLPRMVRILATGDLEDGQPDADGMTGVLDFPPVSDMHLGVVSTNMGAPVDTLPDGLNSLPPSGASCASPGDDGRLMFPPAAVPATTVNPNGTTVLPSEQCGGRSPNGNYLEFQAGDDTATLGQNFACIARLGTGGCGQEQQLDSMLKAVTASPQYTFYRGSTGNGGPATAGTANAGFLREDAVLAVIVVTDEEDCSIPDSNAALMSFATSGQVQLTDTTTGQPISMDLQTPLNLRCGTFPNAQHPIARYAEGLRGLKPLNPELVIFAAIAGIPTALEGMPTQDILNNAVMQFQSNTPNDPFNPQAQPVPSCSRDHDNDPSTPTQDAYPPRRLVELAGQFGENGIVRSICQDDFTSALDTIIQKISDQLKGACLPRELTRTAQGLVACDIVEFIPDRMGQGMALCNAANGRTFDRTEPIDDVNYTVCKINQVAVVDGQTMPNPETPELGVLGWYYDDFSEEVMMNCGATPQRITFTDGAAPPSGATVRFECLQPVLAFGTNPKGKTAVGLSCEGEPAICGQASCTEQDMLTEGGCDQLYGLTCEAQSNTCQITCGNQSDCPNGWQCATGAMGGEGLCILPTCPALEL